MVSYHLGKPSGMATLVIRSPDLSRADTQAIPFVKRCLQGGGKTDGPTPSYAQEIHVSESAASIRRLLPKLVLRINRADIIGSEHDAESTQPEACRSVAVGDGTMIRPSIRRRGVL